MPLEKTDTIGGDAASPSDGAKQPHLPGTCEIFVTREDIAKWWEDQAVPFDFAEQMARRTKEIRDGDCYGDVSLVTCLDEKGQPVIDSKVVLHGSSVALIDEFQGAIFTNGQRIFERESDKCEGREYLNQGWVRSLQAETQGVAKVEFEVDEQEDGREVLKVYHVEGEATISTFDGDPIRDLGEGEVLWLEKQGEEYVVSFQEAPGCSAVPFSRIPRAKIETPGALSIFLAILIAKKIYSISGDIKDRALDAADTVAEATVEGGEKLAKIAKSLAGSVQKQLGDKAIEVFSQLGLSELAEPKRRPQFAAAPPPNGPAPRPPKELGVRSRRSRRRPGRKT